MTASPVLAKNAIIATCETLFPAPVLVTYGTPGPSLPDDVVMVGDTKVDTTRPTMSTSRSREDAVEVTVTFSAFRAGDESVQQDATERAWEMCQALDDYTRTKPNEKLGAAGIREALVTEATCAEGITYEDDEEGQDTDQALGRYAEIVATVLVLIRR